MHRHKYKQLNRDSYLSLGPSRPNKPDPPLPNLASGLTQIKLVLYLLLEQV